MNRRLVDEVAAAVLYEGYLLYPYRPSALKNQKRFNFGVVSPRPTAPPDDGGWFIHTETLVRAGAACELDVRVRFLHLTRRTLEGPHASSGSPGGWQEALEREVPVRARLDELCASPVQRSFAWPAARDGEPLSDAHGVAGLIVRSSEALDGQVETFAEQVGNDLFKITLRISNLTPPPNADAPQPAHEIERSLVSTHAVLHVAGGRFQSLIDPPVEVQAIASACRQVGAWPVLVGDETDLDAVLASPIILYDHPRIAPESAGDFFDGTEIDEMLVLRILTMTDQEKQEMREGDPRGRQMLERTEQLSEEHMMKLHGVLRGRQPAHDGGPG